MGCLLSKRPSRRSPFIVIVTLNSTQLMSVHHGRIRRGKTGRRARPTELDPPPPAVATDQAAFVPVASQQTPVFQ